MGRLLPPDRMLMHTFLRFQKFGFPEIFQAGIFLDFKTKIKDVLPMITGKDFFSKSTPANQLIWNLKDFRDEIIHTKANENPLKYEKLIKTSLNFKYEKTLMATATFMNFYKTDFILECDCGQDF